MIDFFINLSKIDKSINKSHMNESFGSFIKKLRVENNLTLTQLAAKLDLDSANLSKIENGKRDFDEKRLLLLSDAFKIELDELKKEFFGDFIARKIYDSNCSEEILLVAEEKVKYLRSINTKQINLDL
jgi:transcriptional regulator with XRE-family HTH domain